MTKGSTWIALIALITLVAGLFTHWDSMDTIQASLTSIEVSFLMAIYFVVDAIQDLTTTIKEKA